MWLTHCNLLLQDVASVIKHQQTENITALFYVVNVSNILLLFLDALDELTDYITQFISNVCLIIQFSVNFTIIFQTVAKISQNLLWDFFNLGHP